MGCINAALLLSQAPQRAGSSLRTFDTRRGSVHSHEFLPPQNSAQEGARWTSHFIPEAHIGSVHRKTGPGKLLETQLAHSFVGRLVYSFSDAAWRTIDFCANGVAIRRQLSAPGHTEYVLSRSFCCQMYIFMPHTHSCAQNMLHKLPASAVIFLGILSNKNAASYVCELFPQLFSHGAVGREA